MDHQHHSNEPAELFERSTERVHLLFGHQRNRQLLADWLAETYTVQSSDATVLDESVDICLVDDSAFAESRDAIHRWKQAAAPVFAPVLLVSDESVPTELGPDEWTAADGRYVVDDVVTTPVEKPVFHRRMENLLERRALSKSLDSEYRRSEARFSSLFRMLPDPAFVTDGAGRIQFVNDALVDLGGVEREHVVGERLSALGCFDAETAASLEASVDAVVAGESLDAEEVELHTPDGGVRVAGLNATGGTIDGEELVTVVLRDITDRREKEAQLAESEQRFRQMARHLNEVIWMLDAEGDLLYVSPGYERLTGRRAETLEAAPLSTALDHVHPDDRDRVRAEFGTFFDGVDAGDRPDAYHAEYRLVHEDGSVHWVQTDAYPVATPDGWNTRIVGLIDDITERKRREHELERQNDRLEEFAGIVSHDLRNPLQVISARLALLETDSEDADHVEAMEQAADRMDRLIEDLLSLARQGETVSDRERISLRTAARLAWDGVDTQGATLDVETDAAIEADTGRLRQLFENLFRNTMEHGRTDGRAPTVTVGSLADGFYVADDGPGIPDDQRDRVFEKGYTTHASGTGFGLNIVADVAAAHDWTVTTTESAAGGARFEIRGVETY